MVERIYLIGSLRNPRVPQVGNELRDAGFNVFDDWFAAGPEADDRWKDYERHRHHTYAEALAGAAARNVFEFDKRNLQASDVAVLVLPAGRSGHLELGFMLGQGKKGYVLIDQDPERWDVMYLFATGVCFSVTELVEGLRG